jgi:hypothetical protein
MRVYVMREYVMRVYVMREYVMRVYVMHVYEYLVDSLRTMPEMYVHTAGLILAIKTQGSRSWANAYALTYLLRT